MKITVLVDNNTLIDKYFLGEPGLSYFIQTDDQTILFDTGYSDIFICNAQKMGINMLALDAIVFSHGHIDHTWGLSSLIKLLTESGVKKSKIDQPSIIAHPDAFLVRKDFDGSPIGSMLSKEILERHFTLQLTRNPIWITEKLVFLGEIVRQYGFEGNEPIGQIAGTDDYVIDDSALVYKSQDGLVIITGCSHSGICNIIEYAKKICHDERIADIIGGFHLLNPSPEHLDLTVEYLQKSGVAIAHPCHCTGLKSKIELAKHIDVREVGVGMVLEYR